MPSNADLISRIPRYSAYAQLRMERRRIAFLFAGLCVGLCMLFILLAVLAPTTLTIPLNSSGTFTTGVAFGTGLILLSWILTGVYIRIANSRFDAICDQLLVEAKA